MIGEYNIQKPKSNLAKNLIITVIILLIIGWAFTGVQYKGIMKTAEGTLKALKEGVLHPDYEYLLRTNKDGLMYAIVETIAIAISGTFISALISVPFALLASQNIVGKKVSKIGKFIITTIRIFPELVLAIIFIKIVGPGAFAGVLALGVHSIGMLGKLFSEAIESMDMGPSEALDASGGTKFQKLVHAVIPQVMPELMSYTLYRFEINTRAASTLGIVGAGGIGAPMIFAIISRKWPRVAIIVLTLVATVIVIDYISGSIRKRIK